LDTQLLRVAVVVVDNKHRVVALEVEEVQARYGIQLRLLALAVLP
jgi:hypothetical protein